MMLPKISGGFINVTQRCNLACKYCFVKQQPMEIDYKTAKDAVDFYAKNALDNLTTPTATFFGGEPMLRYDDIIKPIVEYIRGRYGDYDLSITTNGTLLNEERLKFLSDNSVSVLLSIDGDKATQDKLRVKHDGSGSFDDIPIDLYRKYYPDETFRATLDPRNVRDMYDNYLFAEGKGYKSVTMIPNVLCEWSDTDIELMKIGLDQIMDHIVDKKSKNEPYATFAEVDKKRDLYKKKSDVRSELRNLPACGTCGLGGTRFASIGPSGDIYSCQEMTENQEYKNFIIGNIYTGVDEERRKSIAGMFNVDRVKSEDQEKCCSCDVKHICDGGCTINNFIKAGSVEIIPKVFCEWMSQTYRANERIVQQ